MAPRCDPWAPPAASREPSAHCLAESRAQALPPRAANMSLGPLSPGTRRRLLQGQAGPVPAATASSVCVFLSSNGSGKGAA